ncbi:MAG: TfoX/Sxy family protein [Candidatus Marinimicrobia bacterium]|nr:TfoX/Sxy family protein [Candidatus Neomarinimicrobiota bacterium]
MAKQYLEKLSAFIEKATADYPGNISLECKHFFSGAALYVEQRICLSLTPVGLAVKLPEETKDKLLKNKQAVPLRYFPKGPIKKDYVLFPGGVENSGKTLHKYVQQSIKYVLTLPIPKRK